MRRLSSATSLEAGSILHSSGRMPREPAAAFFGARFAGARLRVAADLALEGVAMIQLSITASYRQPSAARYKLQARKLQATKVKA
jgi:hypothetical protein